MISIFSYAEIIWHTWSPSPPQASCSCSFRRSSCPSSSKSAQGSTFSSMQTWVPRWLHCLALAFNLDLFLCQVQHLPMNNELSSGLNGFSIFWGGLVRVDLLKVFISVIRTSFFRCQKWYIFGFSIVIFVNRFNQKHVWHSMVQKDCRSAWFLLKKQMNFMR